MKKIICIFMTVIMMVSMNITVLASSHSSMTVQEAAEYVALSFMQDSLNEDVEISETTPFFDLNNNVSAYCVSFEINEKPRGYVLISLIHPGNPIVEFAFEGAGLAKTIFDKHSSRSESTTMPPIVSANDTKVYYLGAGALFVGNPTTGSVQNVFDGETYETISLEQNYEKYLSTITISRNDVVIADGILSWANASIDSSSIEKIDGFGTGSDYWLMNQFSSGNVCSPTCATNILWYWGVQRGYEWVVKNGDKTGFDLADGLFTAMSMHMSTIPALGTLNLFIKGAYTSFISFRGSNFSVDVLTDNDYSDFTAAVDNNCPVHTMLRNESLFSTGHDVMTFGYGESTTGTEYLYVIDGWYDYGRFVDFDYFPIVKGIQVEVGSTAN